MYSPYYSTSFPFHAYTTHPSIKVKAPIFIVFAFEAQIMHSVSLPFVQEVLFDIFIAKFALCLVLLLNFHSLPLIYPFFLLAFISWS